MSYSRLSTKASAYLARELKYSEEKQQIVAYSLDMLFLIVSGYIVLLAIGWLIGIPLAMVSALLAGDILRKFSGGFHLSSPLRCLVTTALIYTAVSLLAYYSFVRWGNEPYFEAVLFLLCLLSIILVGYLAPVDSAAKPIVSPDFRRKLKRSSILVALLLSILVFVFHESYIGACIAGGMAAQSVTLLPVFNKKD